MELIVYVKETHEVCYKCEVCSKVDIINIKEFPKFKSLNEFICILNDDEKIICEQCGNIHSSENPLIIDDEEDLIQCPKCHSTQIQLMKRRWKITTGFLGSSRNERVCLACKHKF